jgi:lipoate-protein ligase A
MNWSFINTGFNTGKFNMDLDLELVNNASKDNVVLRLYRWSPYCISLGSNQKENSVDVIKAKEDNIDIVKRPTGGRAILHAEELTYSVVYPLNDSITPKNLYHEINLALKSGLASYNSIFEEIELENQQPHFPSFYKEEISALCFAVSAKSEINFNGKKLVGSAQRKMGNVILQHGSILCGSYHKIITNYLAIQEEGLLSIRKEIRNTTTEIETITGSKVDYDKLLDSIIKGFEEHFNISFNEKSEQVLV